MRTGIKVARKAQFTQVGKRKLEISNLNKVLCAKTGTIKAEIIAYYLNIAPHIAAPYQGKTSDAGSIPGWRRPELLPEKQAGEISPWIEDIKLGDGDKKISQIPPAKPEA